MAMWQCDSSIAVGVSEYQIVVAVVMTGLFLTHPLPNARLLLLTLHFPPPSQCCFDFDYHSMAFAVRSAAPATEGDAVVEPAATPVAAPAATPAPSADSIEYPFLTAFANAVLATHLLDTLKPADCLGLAKTLALSSDLASKEQATALLPVVYATLLHTISPANHAGAEGAAKVSRVWCGVHRMVCVRGVAVPVYPRRHRHRCPCSAACCR